MTRPLLALAVAIGLGTGILSGQAQQTFRSRVDRVRVDAMVVDNGKPVSGLTAADFEVRDNGRAVADLDVTPTNDSVGVAIALDLGESARRTSVEDLIAATEALTRALEPRDRAWIVTFSTPFALKVGPTSDAAEISRVLSNAEPAEGNSMWDAMFGAVSLAAAHPGRALVLMFTDGVDRTSWLGEEQALAVLRRSDVVVSGVRPAGVLHGIVELEAAAKATGGVVRFAQRGAKLEQQFVDLLAQFRSGYVLSYAPPAGEAKKGWHDIDIHLRNRKGIVRARDGYFEPGR